ncbi:MAG TPA: NPCBM/NEW2 domain-containing protein, partial [Candidatus Limnocylindrales bacterium]|nr:NPCBM/NEW2 domain-containing protein [Candidatus Limnocylindrales bacterium]
AEPLAAATTPSGFADTTVFSGLTAPTAVRFSPDGRVFVAEKSGLIKVFSSLAATTPTVFADLRTQVDNYWDRGLLGFTLDPNFPTSPYAYVLYAYDAPIGGTAPVWNDACPTPPGATTDGCMISGRLSRLTVSGNTATGEQVLINDWCQQFPSHSVGELRFGPDGMLYATGGDGASFTNVDYGQYGGSTGSPTPKNPCGDPPGGVGGSMTAPTAEGGALRSQSVRRPAGQPVRLNGTLIRINPATGAAAADNPLVGNPDANARRVVGYGFRNPFRFTFRPGTNEVWLGDVGADTWEEIDRIVDPKSATVANAGWPCYEGPAADGAYQAATLNLCSSLYSNPAGLLQPWFSYQHFQTIVSGETCATGSSSISGLAFYQGGTYPAQYNGGLFFTDHSRNCIWWFPAGSNGLPDPTKVQSFEVGTSNPVALEIGPGGDLYYVDHEGGAIHRISYSATNHPPTAAIAANPTSGKAPLTVAFDGRGSTDPDSGDTLTYSWDLNGDGQFGDAVLSTASSTYTVDGVYNVGLRVTDSHGASATTSVAINVGGSLPTPVIDTPASSLTWSVGDSIGFSGHATDGQGQAIPASGLSWTIILHHCPDTCHTHLIQTIAGVSSGTFAAPDHDYPSYLELQLTATDSSGKTATTSVSIYPKTATLAIASSPTGLSIATGTGSAMPAPYTKTVIANSRQTVSAPPNQTLGGVSYSFTSWSDGGSATHDVTVPLAGLSLTARYTGTATTSYLSDLAYTVVANGWGPVEKDTSNGEQAAGDGKPITLNGTVYAKGLGAHAASDVRYAMNGTCTSFSVKVGVDDEVGTNGSVVFQIFADGTKLADSGLMTGATATQALTVNVTGKTTLQLVITNGGDNMNYDHGDWADAQITCGASGPPPDTTPPTVTTKSPAAAATNVATSVHPTATFSEAINAATLTSSTFTLTPSGGSPVAASVAYDAPSLTATLTPTAALTAGTTYTARVVGGASGVADLAGNRLAADVTWTFTTAAGTATTSYLSDLAYTVVANGWGPVEKDTSNGEQAA